MLQARIRCPSQGGHSSPKPASHMDSDGAPRTRCGPNLRRGQFHITGLPLVHVMMTAVNMSYNLRMIEDWRRRNLEPTGLEQSSQPTTRSSSMTRRSPATGQSRTQRSTADMRPDLHRGLMDRTDSSPARRVVLYVALTRRFRAGSGNCV